LTKQDERLLDVLGFKDAFRLITDAKIEKIQEKEMIDKSAFKGSNSKDYTGESAILGAQNAI
jgi:hypothetical protein